MYLKGKMNYSEFIFYVLKLKLSNVIMYALEFYIIFDII